MRAMDAQAIFYWGSMEYDEALGWRITIVEHFAANRDSEVRWRLAESMARQILWLGTFQRDDSIQDVMKILNELFENDSTPKIQGFFAQALIHQGNAASRDIRNVIYDVDSKSGPFPRDAWGDIVKAAQIFDVAERRLIGNQSEPAQQARSLLTQARAELPSLQDPSLGRIK